MVQPLSDSEWPVLRHPDAPNHGPAKGQSPTTDLSLQTGTDIPKTRVTFYNPRPGNNGINVGLGGLGEDDEDEDRDDDDDDDEKEIGDGDSASDGRGRGSRRGGGNGRGGGEDNGGNDAPAGELGNGNNNGGNNTALITLGATLAGVVLAPIAAPVVLGAVGFGAGGVIAGSAAAGIQAGIGNVAVGSAFAVAQSVGAGGALPAIGYAISAGVTGLSGFFASKPNRGGGFGANNSGDPGQNNNADNRQSDGKGKKLMQIRREDQSLSSIKKSNCKGGTQPLKLDLVGVDNGNHSSQVISSDTVEL